MRRSMEIADQLMILTCDITCQNVSSGQTYVVSSNWKFCLCLKKHLLGYYFKYKYLANIKCNHNEIYIIDQIEM